MKARQRKPRLPKILTSSAPAFTGRAVYVATLVEHDVEHARWSIKLDERNIGDIFDGGSGYGWGKPRFSMKGLVWSGPFPDQYPKSDDPDGGTSALCFDGGPFDSYQETIDRFAARADRLIAWRHRHLIRKYIEVLDAERHVGGGPAKRAELQDRVYRAESALRAILKTGFSSHVNQQGKPT